MRTEPNNGSANMGRIGLVSKAFDAHDESRMGEFASVRACLRAGASAMAMGLLIAGQAAFAQDQTEASGPAPESATNADGEPNAIVVTGIRQSLANSQNIKRNSDTVVDAITAEDIGALPDRSVTEALQRVPGVAINRFAGSNDPDHFSVEGSGVVIRGLNFVRSEFNGRDAFSAGVNGQSINFADIPSELLGTVEILKNSTADRIEGGLAGTVNLNTRKPFDDRGLHVALSAEANYGDFRKEWTPTISGLVSDTFETGAGTFGLLISGSYSRIKSRADGLQVTNFQTRDNSLVGLANSTDVLVCRNPLPSNTDTMTLPPAGSNCGVGETAGADGFADYAGVRYAPIGGQFRTQDFDRKRDGIAVAAQFESIDRRTTITAQFIRAHTTNAWGEHTFESAPDNSEYNTYPIGCQQNANGPALNGSGTARAQCPVGGFTNYQYDENNLFQSGYITSPNDGWRGQTADGSGFVPAGGVQQTLSRRQVFEETTNNDFALNLHTELTDRLTLDLDGDYTHSRHSVKDFSIFGSTFADEEVDLTGDLPGVVPHKPNFLSYSWGNDNPDLAAESDSQFFVDPRVQFWRAAMDHFEESVGDEYAFKADATYNFSDSAFLREIKVGARYADRDQDIRYSTYNWGALSEVWAGATPVAFADTPAGNYEQFNFPNFFRGDAPGPSGALYYNGDLINNYDQSATFFKSINQQWIANGGQAGWVPAGERTDAVGGSPFRPDEITRVYQRDSAGYGMLRFDTSGLGSGNLKLAGNIGVRYVHTTQLSTGSTRVPTQGDLNISDPYNVRCAATVPPNAPPGFTPTRPGGVCALGPDGYANLQIFAGNTSTIVPRSSRIGYDYWLPSLNLRLGVTDDFLIRFAASKVLTRPQTSYVRNYLSFDASNGPVRLLSGNPNLRPATAWEFDLTAEWYFSRVGSLTVDAFYKDVYGFFYAAPVPFQITNNGVTLNSSVLAPNNFDGHGKVKGVEVAYQQTFDFLPGLLNGLGANANYTYIESTGLPNAFLNTGEAVDPSSIPPGNLPLEGLSKHNFNVAVFYEKGPISARAAYNWRSRFLLTVADVIFPYTSIFNEPTGQLDASIFLNITKNVKIGVQGVNLLNEVTKTTQAYTGDPDRLAPRSYFMNDRRFSFILRGNF